MGEYRFDEDFDGFLEDFGEPQASTPIPDEVVKAYRGILPDQIFKYWAATGACSFHDGLIWMVNPALYQEVLDSWLVDSEFEQRVGLSVFARSAFGELYVWQKGKGKILQIDPLASAVFHYLRIEEKSLSVEEEDEEMRFFWGFVQPEDIDLKDGAGHPLFDQALKKLGRVKEDEMYGYAHRPSIGGAEAIDNLEILKLDVYHDIAQQMDSRQIVKI